MQKLLDCVLTPEAKPHAKIVAIGEFGLGIDYPTNLASCACVPELIRVR